MDTQLTVNKHATLFEACDIFIDTDDDGWMFILANPKARAVVSTLIDMAIIGILEPQSKSGGRPLRQTGAPSI